MPAGRQALMSMILTAAMLVAGGCATFDWSTGKWVSAGNPGASRAARPARPPAPPGAPAAAGSAAPTVVSPAAPAPAAAPVGGLAAPAGMNPAVSPAPAPKDPGGARADAVRRVGGEAFVDAENGAVLHAMDTLAYPRQPVDLVAHLRTAAGLKPIAGATVAFTRGDWVAGRITTDANGVAAMRWTPPEAGNYSFQAGIVAVPNENFRDMLGVKAPLLVASRDKRTPQVVVDLDRTVVDGGKPLADSVEVLGRVSRRYGIIYLTRRPDLLTSKSKSWLAEDGYPSGPLLTGEVKDLPDSGRFKSAGLAALRRDFSGVAIGIGDKLSDAQAYVDNGMSACLIPHYKQDPRDMRALAAEIRALRGQGRLQVVENWRQIEQAISGGKQFPPEDFARQLEARAAKIEAERPPKLPGLSQFGRGGATFHSCDVQLETGHVNS